MSNFNEKPELTTEWICAKCDSALVAGRVNIKYMTTTFNPDLLHCKECGYVLIDEDLALGKMVEVEKLLEDK